MIKLPTTYLLEDWMTIYQIQPTTNEDICITHSDKHIDWTTTSSIYPNMEELITFIVRQKQTFNTRQTTHVIDINNLNDKQSVVYHMIEQNMHHGQLNLIVSGQLEQVNPMC